MHKADLTKLYLKSLNSFHLVNNTDTDFPIDAVIPWVNGQDELHRKKIAQFVKDEKTISSTGFRTKLDQVEEIKFTVHSILKYAPFIRNIFIITDNQIPDFYKNKAQNSFENVFIIDHKDIFGGHSNYLPTFNCYPIETKFYNTPNLAEHFIYFNDDFFLLKPVKKTDFFVNGFPVLRGRWRSYRENLFYKKKKNKASFTRAQENGSKILGFKKYFRFHHTPYPLRKSTLKDFYENNEEIEKNNVKHKFRHASLHAPQGLANHIEIRNKSCILKKDYQLVYFRNYKKPFWWLKFKLKYVTSRRKRLFLNMQGLDQAPKEKLDYILNWLEKKVAN